MAVFPDRIVLKNSTDAEATIIAAIESGGADEIQQGELVIGRESGTAKLYTVDSAGNIVTIAGGGGGGATALGDLTDVDLATTAPQNGDALIYDSINSEWVPGSVSGAVTKIIAGSNVTISPTGGTGDVTINAIGGGGGSATLGRGDGGDIDGTAVDSAFVFGVYGGGDLDTTTEDKPIELVVIGMVDGGDIT